MIYQIYITLIIIAFLILIVSFVYNGKKGVRSSLILLAAVLFALLSVNSFSIENTTCKESRSYDCPSCNKTIFYYCDDVPMVYEGIGYFFSGLSLYCFIMFFIFIFNQNNTEGNEWA